MYIQVRGVHFSKLQEIKRIEKSKEGIKEYKTCVWLKLAIILIQLLKDINHILWQQTFILIQFY